MKGLALYVNIILFLAIAVLYILFFVNGDDNEQISNEPIRSESSGEFKIAYVKTDSLLLNYDLTQDLHDEFTKLQEAYTNEYNSKYSTFEQEATEFQDKLNRGGFLTEQRAIQERDRLVAKEQEMIELDQELTARLTALQDENNNILLERIVEYLEEYNQDYDYDYILSANSILLGNETNNITSVVLEALNERYRNSVEE